MAAAVVLLCGSALGPAAAAPPVICRSPDGALVIEFALRKDGDTNDVPHYRVRRAAAAVIGWSRLGVDLADGEFLGGPCAVTGVETRSVREEYLQFPGKRRQVVGHATEATVRLRETAKPNRRWEVVLRAYDDGVAFRYRFPPQDGWARLEIAGERTAFRLPGDPTTFAMPLPSYTTPHEEHYRKRRVSQFPKDGLVGLPLLAERPGTGWAAILEADLTDYAALYLVRTGAGGASLAARLAPLPQEPKLAVRAALPHESPWRVIMVADKVERLVESDLVLNLNKPNAIGDVSWIKPGKTTFPWWNGFYEKDVPFKMGLNTETAKYYVDFCAEAGIPYHSLDGLDNVAWYGGPIVPYQGADITRGGKGLDLPEVIRYAKAKGVKLRLWMNWKAAAKHMDRAFPLYQEWGIEGVMVDFLDRDDQEISHFIHRLLKTAAANRLTVTIHNTKETTGLERTYPNLLTTEGVRNWEYNKNDWDPVGIPPEEDVMVPFTRMLAGPLDYHQGSLRGVPVAEFKPRNVAPLVMGTPCHMLASYVVYQNHLPMVADYPSAYRGHPVLPVLVAIPTTWDDTRGLEGKVGEYAVVARRSGADWHVGAMTGRKARTLKLSLKFLGSGRYAAELWVDNAGSKHGVARKEAMVTATDELTVDLAAAGGAYLKCTRVQ
jgi:alpha-glucosidase